MKTWLLCAAIGAAFAASAAHAGNLVDVSVIDRDTGTTLSTYHHDGKLYVAGTPGHRYSVRMSNRSGARVLTVLSVDGVNAISGETAAPSQTGYVLDAYQSLEVEGWRKNMSEIAQFNFTSLGDSYAARTGRPNNVGVIGVAVFRERQHPVVIERDDRLSDATPPPAPEPMPSASAQPAQAETQRAQSAAAAPATAGNLGGAPTGQAMPAEKAAAATDRGRYEGYAQRPIARETPLGTGHGARESSYASYTQFERESSQPNEVDSVWYDSYRNLIARGVIPAPRPIAVEPQPFPNRFVPDPAN